MVNAVVIWENAAKTQLKKIYQYIKKVSPQNALKIRAVIIEKIKHAAIYSESFSADKYKTDNDGSYRALELYHYRISYRIGENKIIILRIRHTS